MMFFELVIPPKRFSCPRKKREKNPPISPNLSNIASRCGQGQLGTMRSFRLRKSWGQHISSPGNPGARRCFLHISGWAWIPVDTKKKHYYNRLQHFLGGRISRDHISIYIYLSIDRSIYLSSSISIYLSIDLSIYLSIYIYNYIYIYISIWVFSTRDSMGTHGPILRPAGDEAAPAPQAGWQDNGNVTAMGSENAAGMDRCPGLLLLLLILLAVRQMQPATN